MNAIVDLGGGRGLVDLREVECIEPRGQYPDECTLVMRSLHRISVGSGYNKTAAESAQYWARLVDAAKRPEPTDGLSWLYGHCTAIGMSAKSDSGTASHDIALFTVILKDHVALLRAALEPFVGLCSSEETTTLTVQSEDVRKAREALSKTGP